VYRGKQARRDVDARRAKLEEERQIEREQTEAAIKIGSVYRGRKARQEIEEMKAASTKISSVYRGKKTRAEIAEKRKIV
jgi:hypothetical protein